MQELIRKQLEEMRAHLERAGVKEFELKEDQEVYDKLVQIRNREFQRLLEVWSLVPEGHWQYYEDHDLWDIGLAQCTMLKAAQRSLRRAWREAFGK